MIWLSLFGGMECGRITLDKMGIIPTAYYSAEIDKFARKEVAANYPDVIQLGDVTKWAEWDIPWGDIDMVIGGSPCQGFSFAGKQLAFDDPRSALFFEYVNILEFVKLHNPDVKFMLENVKMKKEHLAVISQSLGVEPVFINSALVCAQNRQRYYWCNWDVPQPEDRGIVLADILESEVDDSYHYGQSALDYLNRRGAKNRNRFDFGYIHQTTKDKSYCLVANLSKGLPFNTLVNSCENPPIKVGDGLCRKLTVVECCRLQGVPDDYFKVSSNTQAYKMLGNGWQCDTIEHIFQHCPIIYR